MSNTTTKSKTAKTDELDVDRYDKAEQEVAAAKAKAAAATDAHEAAEAAAASVRAKLRQGDESVKANDLCEADHAIERARLLADYAFAQAKRIERKALVRPVLANAIVPLLEETYGLEVRVVDTFPSTIDEEPLRPYMLVRQGGKETRDLRNGSLATGPNEGDQLEVQHVRSRLHTRIDWDRLQGAARAKFLNVAAMSRAGEEVGDVARDFGIIRVVLLHEPEMVLAGDRPQSMTLQSVGNRVAALAGRRAGNNVRVSSSDQEVVSHSTSGGKIVTKVQGLTVAGLDAAAGWTPTDETGPAMVKHLRGALEDVVGHPIAGIGYVTKAEAGTPNHKGYGVRTLAWTITAEAVTPKAASK